jgi:PAS domain S-box-containing protein
MRSRENGRLLAEWLADRYEVIAPEPGQLPDGPFDLCIIDGPSLERLWEAVQQRKRLEAPTFLPFLFVALRDDLRLVTRYLYRAVDEMIFMPTEKIELAARLDNLLRSRRHSVALSRQNADMFAGLVEESPLGVFLGREGRYFYMNRAGADLFGYAPAAITGELSPLELVDEDDRSRVAEEVARLESGRADTAHYGFTGRRSDGSRFACEAFERMMTYQGRPARLGILVDVSERNALDAERERSHQAQIDALRHADQLKDQFLGILSHELRTPLNAVLGFGSILEDGVAGELTEMQTRYVHKMLNSAESLLGLITDLLDMSRMQAGKFHLTPSSVALEEVAAEVVEGLEGLGRAKDLTLSLEAAEGLPAIDGDAQRLGQVLTNLIGNAIKFTPRGGTIRVGLRRERGTVLCEVADTGVGIAEADLDRLFQPFSQVDMTNTRSAGGTGLGLSIAKALVETHGGRIGVRSVPGDGSTFWFTVPIRGPGDSTAEPALRG